MLYFSQVFEKYICYLFELCFRYRLREVLLLLACFHSRELDLIPFEASVPFPLYRKHYFICIGNQLTGSPVLRALLRLFAQNDHELDMIIGSKNRHTVRTRLIITMVNVAANALTNLFMSKMFNQTDY